MLNSHNENIGWKMPVAVNNSNRILYCTLEQRIVRGGGSQGQALHNVRKEDNRKYIDQLVKYFIKGASKGKTRRNEK
jgi:hypothetical protein